MHKLNGKWTWKRNKKSYFNWAFQTSVKLTLKSHQTIKYVKQIKISDKKVALDLILSKVDVFCKEHIYICICSAPFYPDNVFCVWILQFNGI